MTSAAQLNVGDRVKRLNDGAEGVVVEHGLYGNVWVQWASSGLKTVITGAQVERA